MLIQLHEFLFFPFESQFHVAQADPQTQDVAKDDPGFLILLGS